MSLAQSQKQQNPTRLVGLGSRRPDRRGPILLGLVLAAIAVFALSTAAVLHGDTRLPNVRPLGIRGNWSLTFDDEFNGSSLNTQLWRTDNSWVDQNHVTSYASNATVANGELTLRLASRSSGAQIQTRSFRFAVGQYAQARIEFAGNGTSIYNWPAFWTAGPGWPASGEQDIFEGAGVATVNYHYALNGADTQAGPFNIPGTWSDGFHTYGIYRGPNYCDVYWDGKLVKRYPTRDDGRRQTLILTLGGGHHAGGGGAAGEMRVKYVRVWSRA